MLTREQQSAVATTEGRLLILAGAGSGKTSVITHRIAHLVRDKKVPPGAILGLTFTNKAAEEMRRRVEAMVGKAASKEIVLSTFHSFCMQILRIEIGHLGYTGNFTLYDERETRRLIQGLVRQILNHEGELPSLDGTIAAISQAKSQALTPEEMTGSDFDKELFRRLQGLMRAHNAVDFDSLLSLTLDLFMTFPKVLEKYQNRFRYVMIDEYQDTNPVQDKLAHLLAEQSGNLCVVGDDDQAIYSWRGADVHNILGFRAQATVKLEDNFRSTPTILAAANSVIQHNQKRHGKHLRSRLPEGEQIRVFHAPTDTDEAASVVQRAISLYHRGVPWGEIAILYRSNILSRPFEIALQQAMWRGPNNSWTRGIPYQVFGGMEFYERSEVKDLLAFLRVIFNPRDEQALLRIVNVPRRGISDDALDLLTARQRTVKRSLFDLLSNPPADVPISDRARKGIASFVQLMDRTRKAFQTSPFGDAFKAFLSEIDYTRAIRDEVKSEAAQKIKEDNVAAFLDTLTAFQGSLADFLGEAALDSDRWQPADNKIEHGKINLMTFHSAKGLEFTSCFLVSLEDHLMPHERSLRDGTLEEERRLMYVGITRAKRDLFLSMSRTRKRYGKEEKSNPSRFLFELPREAFQIVAWDAV